MRAASAARTCWRQQRPRATVVGAVRHTYISKQNVARRFHLLCRGVNSICGKQSAAEYTKKGLEQAVCAARHAYISDMTPVKCRASPEGTTTERSVYPLQGVQTAGCGG